jgi:hypothetical protein
MIYRCFIIYFKAVSTHTGKIGTGAAANAGYNVIELVLSRIVRTGKFIGPPDQRFSNVWVAILVANK